MTDETRLLFLEQLEAMDKIVTGYCMPLYIWADSELIYLPDSLKSILSLYSIEHREVERDGLTYLGISIENYTPRNPESELYGGYLFWSKQVVFLMDEPLLPDNVS